MKAWTVRLIPLWLLLIPVGVVAQTQAPSGSRPFVSVLIAFAVSWLMVAAWVTRIGLKVNRLLARVESDDE